MAVDTRAELREVTRQLAALSRRRDDLIRRGIAEHIRVADLADDADLSVPRIYQVRDRRR